MVRIPMRVDTVSTAFAPSWTVVCSVYSDGEFGFHSLGLATTMVCTKSKSAAAAIADVAIAIPTIVPPESSKRDTTVVDLLAVDSLTTLVRMLTVADVVVAAG